MITLIDADIVAYRCSASLKEDDPVDIAIHRMNSLINQILHDTKATQVQLFLSGQENFRKNLSPEYKANRTADPPVYLQECKEYLVMNWGAKVADSIEADDSIGIEATKLGNTPFIIASLDKDLTQIPGFHHQWEFSGTSYGKSWVKPRQDFYVSYLDGLRRFYKQMLIGDPADNVKGIDGIGKVKAGNIIDPLTSEQEMFDTVRVIYNDDERCLLNGKLLWILREENKIWQFPSEESEPSPDIEVS